MHKKRTHFVTGAGFGLALVILVLLGWFTYRDMTEARLAAQEVDHTYVVLRQLDQVFSGLKDAETGQRGYVITGKEEYLKPYHAAAGDIDRRIRALRELTRDNRQQQARLDDIDRLAAEKLDVLKRTIAIRKTSGYRAAIRIIESGAGEELMDEIRGNVAKARSEESALLNQRLSARRTASRHLIEAIVAGGAVGLALLLAAFFLLMTEIIRRTRIEEELRKHQEGLEDLVEERTRDIAVANSLLRKEIEMRERAEEELKKSMQELAHSNRELDRFASIASHDLQSPLRAVGGFVSLLHERYRGKLDAKADEYILHATNGVKRMSALIHDLYVYSRIGTQGKKPAAIELEEAFRGAVENLRQVIEENQAVVTNDPLPLVQGDETQFVQLFQNLLGNAVKFRKKDVPPAIRVSAERKETEWVIGVHDNGIGIEPRFHDRIFVIFQRLHTTEEYPGTGLGLALCSKIVERHGGRIWIESEPGRGSSFYFTLPLSSSATKQAGQ